MGDKTKVTITSVPWHEGPPTREAILKDAKQHRKEAANRSAAAKRRTAQGKRPSKKAMVMEVADNLKRNNPALKQLSASAFAPHVQRHWKGIPKTPSLRTIRRYLSRK